jgi:hypothetical protein
VVNDSDNQQADGGDAVQRFADYKNGSHAVSLIYFMWLIAASRNPAITPMMKRNV